MKKLLFVLIATSGSLSAIAQGTSPKYAADSLLPRWVLDINLLGGMGSQNFTTANSTANYPNALNANTGELKYKNGSAIGADAQLGFFFGKKRHFGLGTGFMYMQQYGDAVLNNFHIEYQATDGSGNTYRQLMTGNNVKERISSANMNIPIVLKYKNRFSKHWGFAADAGAVINLQMKNTYNTHATFDYEAIYKFGLNEQGDKVAIYDNSPIPSVNDWMITKAEFLRNNPDGNLQNYFDQKRALGFGVGQAMAPKSTKGNTSYTTGSVGFIIQPSFSYFLSDNAALNFGLFYMYQPFKSNALPGYRLSDVSGNYSSVMNNVTATTNQVYGLNIGARFFLGRHDRDHDGVADRKDKCPDVFGLAKFDGCPDTDGDGVPDKEDSCVTIAGSLLFHGCPDSDGDGIIDRLDECPLVFGLAIFHGCPDKDGDGIPDKLDDCPEVFGLAALHGCPDRDGDGIADKDDRCPDVFGLARNQGCPLDTVKVPTTVTMTEGFDISTPILFDLNKTTVHKVSYPVLDEAAEELKTNKRLKIDVEGHADTTGPEALNRGLSLRRANSVKNELVKRGVDAKRIKTRGHGSRIPAATNMTAEGRQENRRAVMNPVPGKK